MTRLRVALFFSALTQQSNLMISFASIAVVARLLTPAEIGVFAVASSLTVLATEMRSFGVGQYLVREPELGKEKQQTALGMMILISWALAIIVIIVAPLAATFYRQPDLKYIFWIISGTFIIAPFSTVPFSILLRNMRFDLVMRIKLVSGCTRAAGSIGFVLLGWSYFGLAASVLLGAIVELAAITWIDRSKSLLRPSFRLWREILGFGIVTSATGVLQRFTQSVPDLVLGRTGSMLDVGIFSRGLGMILFINRLISMAVNPIILPHLAGIRRKGGDIGPEYLKCIVLHGAVSLPAFAIAGVLALPLIRLFFGGQWDAAAPIASALAIWAMLQTVHGFLSNALLALGLERVVLWKEAAVFSIRLILILIATKYGLLAVAWSICLSGLFEFILSTVLIHFYLNIGPKHFIKSFFPNIILASICWIIASHVFTPLSAANSSSLVQIISTGTVALIVWITGLRVFRHELWTLGVEFFDNGILAIRRSTKNRDKPHRWR